MYWTNQLGSVLIVDGGCNLFNVDSHMRICDCYRVQNRISGESSFVGKEFNYKFMILFTFGLLPWQKIIFTLLMVPNISMFFQIAELIQANKHEGRSHDHVIVREKFADFLRNYH